MAARKILVNALKYGFALSLLAYVVYRQWDPPGGKGLSHLWHDRILTGQINWLALVGAWLSLASASAITIVRWGMLIRAIDIPLPWKDVWNLGWVGILFNNLLPGSVGGDLVKATLAAKPFPGKRTFAVASVIFDRVMALWGLFALSGAAWITLNSLGWMEEATPLLNRVARVVAISCAGMLGLWWVLGLVPEKTAEVIALRLHHRAKLLGVLGDLLRAMVWYRHRPLPVFLAMVVTTCGQLLFVLSFYLVSVAIEGIPEPGQSSSMPSLLWHYLLVPLGMVLMAVPLFPGGLGIGEWGYGALYSQVIGEPGRASGVAASLGQRVLNWLVALLGLKAWGSVRWHQNHPTHQETSTLPSANGVEENQNPDRPLGAQ